MIKKFKLPTQKQLLAFGSNLAEKSLVLVVVIYIAISVGRSVMKNYEMNIRINELKQQLSQLEQEQSYLNNLIAYYKTDTYKELKAREELGLQRPGENVLSVPVDPDDKPLGTKGNSFIADDLPEELPPLPNYQKWFNYFFGG